MVKLIVMYGPPQDTEAFEEHYANIHAPLAAKIPDVKRFESGLVTGTPDGSTPAYHRIAELWFEGEEQMRDSLATPEAQAAVGDIQTFATGGATVLFQAV